MFCPKCGKEVPDDSQFCLKCGHTLTAAAPATCAPIPNVPTVALKQRTGTRSPILTLIGLAILAFSGWRIYVALITEPHTPGTPTAIQSILDHNDMLVNSTLTVKPLTDTSIKFVVPQAAVNVSVDGHFSTSGGFGNDIEVYVFTEDNFVNFENSHQSSALYNSQKVTQGTINVSIPSGGGTYYLVFNNKFSLISSKTVQADAMLHYMH